MQQGSRAIDVLDAVLSNSNADGEAVSNVVAIYYSMRNFAKLEAAFRRLVQVAGDAPENWYNLASLEAAMNQSSESLQDLRRALEENTKRLARDPSAMDLRPKQRQPTRTSLPSAIRRCSNPWSPPRNNGVPASAPARVGPENGIIARLPATR